LDNLEVKMAYWRCTDQYDTITDRQPEMAICTSDVANEKPGEEMLTANGGSWGLRLKFGGGELA
jgi:hypothetical protein